MNKYAIILAAGKGTRMKSDRPKVLHEVAGKTMLAHVVSATSAVAPEKTIAIVGHGGADVLGTLPEHVAYVKQEEQLGTGHAVKIAEPLLKNLHGMTLVIAGDTPLIRPETLEEVFAYHQAEKATATILTAIAEDPTGYGRIIREDGHVAKIVEQKDATIEELKITTANAGIYQFETKFLLENLPKLNNNNAQKEYYITDLVEMAISQGKVLKPLIVNEENFKGVNSKVELADAEVIHQNRIKKEFMKAGVILRLPDTIYIEEGVTIEGESIIENGVSLLGNSKIINSHIKTNSVVEDSIVKDSDVGPMARIRPDSELNKTHIGNFVETKKAKLNGVKAGHLSYLGDCSIDEGTNIGCGTITCNYDGVNKHQTIIGKNVFVGSDTQFVAPVNIEDDVLIGAGSTVTGNVKKGELYLTRAKAKTIDGYFYKHFDKAKKAKEEK